jgi:hypothetical protein
MLLSNGSAAQTTEVFEEWVKETAEQGLHQQGFTAIDAAANVHLTGSTLNPSGNYDILLTKTDRKGNELWSITFDGPGGGEDAATNVVLDNSGFVYVCGTVFVSTAAGNNYFLAKLDSSGNEIWRFDYDNNRNLPCCSREQ